MRLSVSEIAEIIGAEKCACNAVLDRIATDSRACCKNDLFACIAGSRSDGHNFAAQAQENGAGAILAERTLPDIKIPVLVVKNTVAALQKLATAWREKFTGIVVAITGTAGKTTLKEALAAILAHAGTVNATEKNHNNQLGVALTILNASGMEDFWLIEAGISKPHDMDELGAMIKPDLAILLNVGAGHSEGLGERGVAWHKARLLAWLNNNGKAVINADYPDLMREAREYAVNAIYFGADKNIAFSVALLGEKEPGAYELLFRKERQIFKTPYYGEWGAEITLAASAAATALDLDPECIREGFNSAAMPRGRINQIFRKGFLVLDDTYNANPLSMRRMLESSCSMAHSQGRDWIAVLGEMGELGTIAPDSHRELGRQLGKLKPRMIFWKGAYGDETQEGLKEIGETETIPFYRLEDPSEFARKIGELASKGLLSDNSLILFKGSRMNRMEDYANSFLSLNI